jgi:hypothetical protein
MKWNLNIIWLNPFILIALFTLIFNKAGTTWYKLIYYISILFFILHFFLPQSFNIAILHLVLILVVRSSVRAGFEWNPLSVK